jgi:chemotaxis protein methyltransferase CheR
MFGLQLQEFSEKEFEEFCKYIYDNVGIKLTDKKRNLVHNRLRKRLIALEFDNYGEYFRFVKSLKGKEELIYLINAITTNVTTFFRDPKQFQTFSQLVLPCYENVKRRITIWSAGCSTGEEPYSIAIEILKYVKDLNFQIMASDLSTKVLETAEMGAYPYEQVKTVSPQYLSEFFTKKGDLYEVKPIVKKYVTFKKLNLIEDSFPQNVDIIFCRNVVIYFDKETKDTLYKKFHQCLNPQSFLFVGHSESLFSSTLFKFFKPSVYRRVDL